jgi:hypothetical protein
VLIQEATVEGRKVLTMSGVLDSVTYRTVRDRVIKAALDRPDSVVVDVTGLLAPTESAWSVFTSARWHLTIWPEVPIELVCGHAEGRHALARNGITRYLPVYDTVEAAAAAVSTHTTPAGRRRVRRELPAEPASVDAARRFVTEWLTSWEQSDFAAAATVVVTVLVENVLHHTDSAPALRLESSGDTVTVAVQDNSATLPSRLEKTGDEAWPTGLCIVAATSRVWGTAPLPDGKVVWAVIGPENRL